MSMATDDRYEMTAQDWAEFEEDFAIVVEMMAQSLNGKTPDYSSAKRAVRAELEKQS